MTVQSDDKQQQESGSVQQEQQTQHESCADEEDTFEDFGVMDLFTNTEYVTQNTSIPCYYPPTSTPLQEVPDCSRPQSLNLEIACSQSASTDFDLTGQIIWPVSALLAHYVASKRGQDFVSEKRVVELGAGCGLPGLVAAHFANKVVLTDGNDLVIDLLKTNASKFASSSSPTEDILSANITNSANDESCSSSSSKTMHPTRQAEKISVQKYLWGDLNDFTKLLQNFDGSPVDVVIAADVVQWTAVVEPLLHSVKALLWREPQQEEGEEDRRHTPIFILGIVQRYQSTADLFFDLARDMGFVWKKVNHEDFLEGGIVPDSCKEHGGRVTELFEITLADRSSRPILLNQGDTDSDRDLTLGENFENTCSLPC